MATPVIFSYTILDSNGVKTNTPLHTVVETPGYTPTFDEFVEQWGVTGNLLDNMIDGQIVGGHVFIPCDPVAGMKTAPVAGQDVSDVGAFRFRNIVTRYLFAVLVPSLSAAVLSGARINLANAAVAAFLAHLGSVWVGSTTGAGAEWTNPDGQRLAALAEAEQVDHRHRKKLTAVSKVVP